MSTKYTIDLEHLPQLFVPPQEGVTQHNLYEWKLRDGERKIVQKGKVKVEQYLNDFSHIGITVNPDRLDEELVLRGDLEVPPPIEGLRPAIKETIMNYLKERKRI